MVSYLFRSSRGGLCLAGPAECSCPQDTAPGTAISGLRLADVHLFPNGDTLLCNVSTSPLVQLSLQPCDAGCSTFYMDSHPGIQASQRLIALALTSLCTRLTTPRWTEQLPWALLGIHSAVHEDFSCSATDLVFRHSPVLPTELFCRVTPSPPFTTPPRHSASSSPPPMTLPLDASP